MFHNQGRNSQSYSQSRTKHTIVRTIKDSTHKRSRDQGRSTQSHSRSRTKLTIAPLAVVVSCRGEGKCTRTPCTSRTSHSIALLEGKCTRSRGRRLLPLASHGSRVLSPVAGIAVVVTFLVSCLSSSSSSLTSQSSSLVVVVLVSLKNPLSLLHMKLSSHSIRVTCQEEGGDYAVPTSLRRRRRDDDVT